MSKQKEFGDFQTPSALATRVTSLVAQLFPDPDRIIEPTAGLGTFLKAAHHQWGEQKIYQGFELNPHYVSQARVHLPSPIEVHESDFFSRDWTLELQQNSPLCPLVLGNPPWVTNSNLGALGSANLPQKTNAMGLPGLEAITGKSNFDIAEWMILRLIEALPSNGALAMLCKTMTARKVLKQLWEQGQGREESALFLIDARVEFDVSVDACLFYLTGRPTGDLTATTYSNLSLQSQQTVFGYRAGQLVSNLSTYETYQHLANSSKDYTWRSGIKHDAAKVMELTLTPDGYLNGLGETVSLEEDYLYPLLKSSDLGNGRSQARKVIIVPQSQPNEDPSFLAERAPKTWNYLLKHKAKLDSRGSSIYQKRPRFSIFGIGKYSFAPWKVAISGLYKNHTFVLIPPVNGRPVMLDDTCYAIACQTKDEAESLLEHLNSSPVQSLLSALTFPDSKRPITSSILQKLTLLQKPLE